MFQPSLLDKFVIGCLTVDYELSPHGKQWMIYDQVKPSNFILIDEKTAVLFRLAKQMEKQQEV